MTQQDAARTYDDLPESDVSTVLQVPLLWGSERATDRSGAGGGAHRRPSGRHRAHPRTDPGTDSRANGRAGRAHRQPEKGRPERELREGRQPAAAPHRVAAVAEWADHPMVHTARIGLVSAGLVLALFAGVLFALAIWLP